MQRMHTHHWLNLLLVIAMVIGPWPVLSDTTDAVGECCMASMEMAEDMRHTGCGSQPDQDQCCMDQGCAGSNCSVTVYISLNIHIDIPTHPDTFTIAFGESQPTGISAPPTPPPIV